MARGTGVVVHDPAGTPEEAFRLGALGAAGFIPGRVDPAQLAGRLETAVEAGRSLALLRLAEGAAAEPWSNLLVGRSRAIRKVLEVIRLVGARRCTVLITGETGTGKEMAARSLHLAGPRASKPLVTVNCSALPEHLLEAELFGHVKGAFTGAVNHRVGRFEQADGGTLFLDEIGDMPLELQVKLLRVLQEREFQRLGSSETIRVDIRVAAASNADLVERVRLGKFREDLYYRLNVVPVTMPPLRERTCDIPLLVRHFLDKIARQEGTPAKTVRQETLDRLTAFTWPGNVRQLENAVEMAVALSGDRETLQSSDFPVGSGLPTRAVAAASHSSITVPAGGLDYDQTVGAFERQILEQAMLRSGGNKKRAADLLRLKRTTLSAKLRSLEARAACGR
ncbi:MAG: sigma-54-dependent Fis family transcriptional regulator [Bryobacterales bacterium]|nr:sigma-54-dependent Fis family transcriptional regulator [Bryobacterales bacterium]